MIINTKKILLFILFIFSCVLKLKILILKNKDDFSEMEKFTMNNMKGYSKFSKLKYLKFKFPKISIVITVFNGEGYIKPVLRSIQNQDFLSLEIIIVDDCSLDNSVGLIKELMKEDKRIILITNTENRGTLYSKTKGILCAIGKYVISLDHDNLYSTKFAFSILYEEAEKYNVDYLGFSSIVTSFDMHHLKDEQFKNYIETPIINKPFIKERYLNLKKTAESSTSLCLYFIRTELLKNIIKKLGDEIINRKIDAGDDTILIFLLSRYANSLKHIKRILHLIFAWPMGNNPLLQFQNKNKKIYREQKKCMSILTLIEVLLLFTENNFEDKNIAVVNFRGFYLSNKDCRSNRDKNIVILAEKICKLFLENKYIEKSFKDEIKVYLSELKK